MIYMDISDMYLYFALYISSHSVNVPLLITNLIETLKMAIDDYVALNWNKNRHLKEGFTIAFPHKV